MAISSSTPDLLLIARRRHAAASHFLLMSASEYSSRGRPGLTRSMGEEVVYVHGLWMSGGESLLLRRRLAREFGVDGHPFRSRAGASTMTEITSRLQKFVRELKATRLHFVGHSLGGLVIYRFLERYPQQPPGRVVFLGTPSVASRPAVQASHIRLVASLMGRSVADALLRPRAGGWGADRDCG